MAFKVRVEGGKYTVVQNAHGELRVDRGDIRGWLEHPEGGKMLIALACEVEDARKLLHDIIYDFDPEEVSGPPCGSEMLARITKYMLNHQIEDEDCIEGSY
jgi:hypothetical protein